MKITFLDADTLGKDISLEKFNILGEVEIYGFTTAEQALERTKNSDVIITNKVLMNESTLGSNPNARLICITATGTNVVDFDFATKQGITVTNVKSYSTDSVVQHTFALMFYLIERLRYYDDYVKLGKYANDTLFTHFENKYNELSGKTWGIIGLGEIGKNVARIAESFGCKVIYYSTSGNNSNPDFTQVDFNTLLSKSDIISIHAPLNPATNNLFTFETFRKMKKTSILINVGRGPIINEGDLVKALEENEIAGAGLDVLSVEPMEKKNPLLTFKDSSRLIITPHIAWASIEARNRLVEEVYKNIEAYMNGEERNRVNP
ncbi:MAG: D-2-hydroxyacid dehydrogenase [Clostridiales bacterium]|nr:D-2-hydroxyacid dehydrogenase [Clostridiales bacterium]